MAVLNFGVWTLLNIDIIRTMRCTTYELSVFVNMSHREVRSPVKMEELGLDFDVYV